ncbi:GMC family oxidoreductase [Labrys sp. ZIDIC5]|uniref:GMC family oxidoreductase n=1 Tax=Labrys sedimenti TaxID=3106036 RepID=UPI002ACAFF8F|nr:GMC family oxidoreductase N-terminal domain-containing protein [Labrys sp. ZIDIC5]MDZ5450128.1 GMC family oxidoreductase N-terminal domain-containing protein [Labrys sp. ZIDIC5]
MAMTYDTIIVGGGSSGCVTAMRLVRDLGQRVLMLEAGPARMNPIMHMPAGYMKYLAKDTYLTMHRMERQPQLDGRATIVPQGRVLGGGSSVNAMVYMRGQPADYDNWAENYGAEGWRYADILPHFIAMEGNADLDTPVHGTTGPLKVTRPLHTCEMTRAFLQALPSLGEPLNPDFNSGRQRGVGLMQGTMDPVTKRRCSAVDAFLPLVRDDERLTITTEAIVTRLIIEGISCTGVEYVEGGRTHRASAATVILAAGTYVTPKLLMLSGIGPADHLLRHGIKPRVDLPGVGENLQDHCEVPVIAASNGRYGYFGQDKGWNMIRNGLDYLLRKQGPVTTTGVEACVFTNPDDREADASLKIYCVPTVYLDRDITDVTACDGVTFTTCLLRPKSRGTVRLRSADPLEPPVVDGGFLKHSEDIRLMIAGLRFARSFLDASPIREKISHEMLPGADKVSDADLHAHCKRMVKTNYHPVGTARMGRDDDPMAVLDSQLRVRGIEGLRVFDCSVMPEIVSANTNAPVMAIAHRAVEWLKMG